MVSAHVRPAPPHGSGALTDNPNDGMALSAEAFARTRWLSSVGGPVPGSVDHYGSVKDIHDAVASDPEAFFEPPYQKPYEDWCVADHRRAEVADPDVRAGATTVSKDAFLAAFDVLPDSEIAGLFSDDVHTIYTLLRMGESLSPFTVERATWIMEGRVPWGYSGSFPGGRWRVL